MAAPSVPSYGSVTVKALADLPARILGGTGVDVTVAGFDYRIDLDIAELQTSPLGAAAGKWTAVWDQVDGSYKRIQFTELPAPNVDWSVITSKPTTFPPTLPIAQADVTGLPAALTAKLDNNAPSDGKTYGRKNGAWQDVAAGVTFVVNWTDILGKPATFPPSAHVHPESDITGLVADLAARELVANKGAANGYAPLDATSKVPAANLPAFPEAPSDGKVYGRNGSIPAWSAITGAYVPETGPTGAANLPTGTTAQRPANAAGLFRYNTDLGLFEGNTGSAWSAVGGAFVAKSGDVMSGPLRIGATLVTAAFATSLMADLVASGTVAGISHHGFNSYINSANTAWIRLIAGYGGDIQFDPAIGKYQWLVSPTSAAAGSAIASWAAPLTLDNAGNLQATGTIAAAASVTVGSGLNVTSGGANITGGMTMNAGAIVWSAIPNFTLGSGGISALGVNTQFDLTIAGTGSAYFWTTTGAFPTQDNARYLGAGSNRWYQVWAVAGTIQTSDEREKQDIRSLDDKERAAAQAIKQLIVAYRWRPGKGAAAHGDERLYIGVIAQAVEQALTDAGLVATDYAMWSKDALTEFVDGVPQPTGEYRYSVDYSQVLAFIIGAL